MIKHALAVVFSSLLLTLPVRAAQCGGDFETFKASI